MLRYTYIYMFLCFKLCAPNWALPIRSRVLQGIPQWESVLPLLITEKNRRSLAIFDRKEIAHLGP